MRAVIIERTTCGLRQRIEGRREPESIAPNLYSYPLIFKAWPHLIINPPIRKLRRCALLVAQSKAKKSGEWTSRWGEKDRK